MTRFDLGLVLEMERLDVGLFTWNVFRNMGPIEPIGEASAELVCASFVHQFNKGRQCDY